MKIIVNDLEAAIKEGSSFDYVSENRLFMNRDDYTLDISFPLANCRQNIEIFGHINRKDVTKARVVLPCHIISRQISLSGELLVTDVDQTEVKCQFISGRCSQSSTVNLDDVFINELPLGEWPVHAPKYMSPAQAWNPDTTQHTEVALPWVNDASDGFMNNQPIINDSGDFEWHADTKALSWQPFLFYIATAVANACGYECDFSEWKNSPFYHLLVCNTLPADWGIREYAKALPHWSAREFFDKLELLLFGEFEFNRETMSASFRFSKNVIADIPPVLISDVVDQYSSAISNDDDANCEWLGNRHLAYKSASHSLANTYSCQEFIDSYAALSVSRVITYNSVEDMITSLKVCRHPKTGEQLWGEAIAYEDNYSLYYSPALSQSKLYYVKRQDTWFMASVYGAVYGSRSIRFPQLDYFVPKLTLLPINQFAPGTASDDSSDDIEFVPACIQDTDEVVNECIFLSPSDISDDVPDAERVANFLSEEEASQRRGVEALLNSDSSEQAEAYSEIYVAFYLGMRPDINVPYPFVDPVRIDPHHFKYYPLPYNIGCSLRLKQRQFDLPKINPAVKLNFSWLANSIPNPRAIFNICGKQYICEKITATFSENGMSQLLKGEFYPIIDD